MSTKLNYTDADNYFVSTSSSTLDESKVVNVDNLISNLTPDPSADDAIILNEDFDELMTFSNPQNINIDGTDYEPIYYSPFKTTSVDIDEPTTPNLEVIEGTGTLGGGHLMVVYRASAAKGANKVTALSSVAPSPIQGDIGIVEVPIAGGKTELTAYAYNGSQWIALDGNYDADNVYFDEDLMTTAAIGNITLSNGQATIPAAGKTITEVWNTIFVKAMGPTVTQPSVSITLSGAGAKEVGTEFTPSYSVSFNAGSYQYGPATGITATYAVSDSNGKTATTASGSFTKFTITESTNYKVSVTATHTAGAIPKNNLGADVPNSKIAAGTKSANSSNVTGYRAWFCGYKTSSGLIANPASLTSAQVRGLGTSQNGSFPGTMTTNKMQQMFFAAPKGLVKSIAVANSTNGAPQTVAKGSASVEGANGFTAVDYDIFYVNNASAESGSTTFRITVSK